MGGGVGGFPDIKCIECGRLKYPWAGHEKCCECAAKSCKEVELLLCENLCASCGKHPVYYPEVPKIMIHTGTSLSSITSSSPCHVK
jgi:hypothetical protein